MLTVFFAFAAGLLTIAAPCTLPVLPVLLGSSIGAAGRGRPLFMALGFVTAFALAAIVFSLAVRVWAIDQNTLRTVAVVLLIVFGAAMLWPAAADWLSLRAARLVPSAAWGVAARAQGNAGAFVLGSVMGLIWTPCAGPVLASILTLIATSEDVGAGAQLLFVYALGAAVPMFAIAYGGQMVGARLPAIARVGPRLRQAFGLLTIASALAIQFQYDTTITAWLADFYPEGRIGL